jgi:apolipoprotein N-acyltransferase
MFASIRFFYPFILGLLFAAFSDFSSGAWLQIITLGFFWRHIHRHHFHGGIYQAKIGWVFGLGYFLYGLWWIYVSLHDVGGMPFWMATAGVFILSAFLALFICLAIWVAGRFYAQSYSAIAWAAAWTLTEWLRGHILTGFPWLGIGDTQVAGPFMGLIPIFGVLGATFAAAWSAYKIGSAPERLFLPLFSLAFFVFIVSFFNQTNYTKPIGNLLEVRLLQGNYEQKMEYDEAALVRQNNFYLSGLIEKPIDLIVAPETAITIPENQLDPNWNLSLKEFAKNTNTHILTGIIGFENNQYANQARGFLPSGEVYSYTKAHLVPFGEYIPPGFEWFVRAIQAPLSQFKKGSFVQTPFKITRASQPDIFGMPMICYEDVFGSEIAKRVRREQGNANLLINMTNLAWFGNTSAPKQQLRLAQLRSLETGLPTIRATNTGYTAIINDHGQVQSKLAVFTQGSLLGSIQPRTGQTPYVQFGDLPILIFSLICLCLAWFQKKQLGSKNRGTVNLNG